MCTHILYVFVSYNNSSNRITLLRQDKERVSRNLLWVSAYK